MGLNTCAKPLHRPIQWLTWTTLLRTPKQYQIYNLILNARWINHIHWWIRINWHATSRDSNQRHSRIFDPLNKGTARTALRCSPSHQPQQRRLTWTLHAATLVGRRSRRRSGAYWLLDSAEPPSASSASARRFAAHGDGGPPLLARPLRAFGDGPLRCNYSEMSELMGLPLGLLFTYILYYGPGEEIIYLLTMVRSLVFYFKLQNRASFFLPFLKSYKLPPVSAIIGSQNNSKRLSIVFQIYINKDFCKKKHPTTSFISGFSLAKYIKK